MKIVSMSALALLGAVSVASAQPASTIHNFEKLSLAPGGDRIVNVENVDPGNMTKEPHGAVVVRGATDTYMWDDRSLAFHRCKICGCVTHWSPVDVSRNRMGVNANLMPRDVLEKATISPFDGASM